MVRFLKPLGVEFETYCPDRDQDGYGLNENIATKHHIQLCAKRNIGYEHK